MDRIDVCYNICPCDTCECPDSECKLVDAYLQRIDTEYELRLLNNYLHNKPKAYRQGRQNFVVVRDLLMSGTSHSGMTSCIAKCRELGIDPYGHDLKGAVKDE